jgi:hypothetical protein
MLAALAWPNLWRRPQRTLLSPLSGCITYIVVFSNSPRA